MPMPVDLNATVPISVHDAGCILEYIGAVEMHGRDTKLIESHLRHRNLDPDDVSNALIMLAHIAGCSGLPQGH
jgi:hypothetical protein